MDWNPGLVVRPQARPSAIKPYAHQLSSWDAMSRVFGAPGRAGLLVLPTGAGKTFVAASWLLRNEVANGSGVLWLTHRKSLLRQAFRTFLANADLAYPKETLGLCAVSSDDRTWSSVSREHDVVFSSIQTAGRPENLALVEAFLRRCKRRLFVVVDEAHHASAPTYHRLLKQLRDWQCPVLGLTATPVRMLEEDERRLHAMFDGRVIHQVTRRALIDQGILAAPRFETVATNVALEREFTPEEHAHLARYGELAPSVLSRLAKNTPRNKLIVRHYVQRAEEYGPTIVFAADTLHAYTLAEEFKWAGVDADYVDYGRPDAHDVIESYRLQRAPTVLVNVEMLTEGFDAPHTRTVLIARPTRSEGLLSQMVGRALRGPRSGGNERAHLVTFLDTWQHFNVLDPEYVLQDGATEAELELDASSVRRIEIPVELVQEAYRIVQSITVGDFTGVFEALPHSWYAWEETTEDDARRRVVLVYEHQVEAWSVLLAQFPTADSVRDQITEERAKELARSAFVDLADPLPAWQDVRALLEARRQGAAIQLYTFEEKKIFDPRRVAHEIFDRGLPPKEQRTHLQSLWDGSAPCRSVYRNDVRAFIDDVSRELNDLMEPPPPPPPPELVAAVPPRALRAWPTGELGYSLIRIHDAVAASRKNFPAGAPAHGGLRWSRSPMRRSWGFFRQSDRTITVNCVLDSPEVPLFVLEFLLFHELLHAEMPHAGHGQEFRARERAFVPSAEAVERAHQLALVPGTLPGAWRALADGFLDTFDRYYEHKRPGRSLSH